MILLDNNNYSSPTTGDGYTLIQAGPCFLYEVIADNLSGSNRWVQVYDCLTGPAVGQAPVVQLRLPSATQGYLKKELPLYRWKFQYGLFIVSSTTGNGYTAGGDTDLILNVSFGQ